MICCKLFELNRELAQRKTDRNWALAKAVTVALAGVFNWAVALAWVVAWFLALAGAVAWALPLAVAGTVALALAGEVYTDFTLARKDIETIRRELRKILEIKGEASQDDFGFTGMP